MKDFFKTLWSLYFWHIYWLQLNFVTDKCAKAGPNHFMQIKGGGRSIWMFTFRSMGIFNFYCKKQRSLIIFEIYIYSMMMVYIIYNIFLYFVLPILELSELPPYTAALPIPSHLSLHLTLSPKCLRSEEHTSELQSR